MKKLIFLFTLFLSFTLIAQNTDKAVKKLTEITGIITLEDYPLSGVNILIKNSNRSTDSNKKGFYKIKARGGEIIQFSHLNMKPIEILVEDVTTILNLRMSPSENLLEEIIITSKSDNKKGIGIKTPRKFSSERMNIDTRRAGFAAAIIQGDDINKSATSLAQALRSKISNYKLITNINGLEQVRLTETCFISTAYYPLWDVEETLYTQVPTIDLNEIKDIAIIKGLAETVKYGSQAVGDVIVVTTKSNYYASIANKDINKDYYDNDAIAINDLKN